MTKKFARESLRADATAHMPVHLIVTKDKAGEACYFILRATRANYQKLQDDSASSAIDIARYGEILLSGFGSYPSPIARSELREKYGIELPQNL